MTQAKVGIMVNLNKIFLGKFQANICRRIYRNIYQKTCLHCIRHTHTDRQTNGRTARRTDGGIDGQTWLD